MFPKFCYLFFVTVAGFALMNGASPYASRLAITAGGVMAVVGLVRYLLVRFGESPMEASGKGILPFLWTAGIGTMILGFGTGAVEMFFGGAGLILSWVFLTEAHKISMLLDIAQKGARSQQPSPAHGQHGVHTAF